MEKIYLADGKEVQIGDTLTKVFKMKDPFYGESTVTHQVVITNDILPKLLEAGIVTIEKPEISTELEYYIQKIAKKLDWKFKKAYNYLNNVHDVLPAAACSIMLREIAIELDKKYENHIEESPEIYVISMLDGRINRVNKAHIKNYRNFAAFRSVEDAKIACFIMRDLLKEMFKNNG